MSTGNRHYYRILSFSHPNGNYWEIQEYIGSLSLNDVDLRNEGWERLEPFDCLDGYWNYKLGPNGGFTSETAARWYLNRISIAPKRLSIIGAWEEGQLTTKNDLVKTFQSKSNKSGKRKWFRI